MSSEKFATDAGAVPWAKLPDHRSNADRTNSGARRLAHSRQGSHGAVDFASPGIFFASFERGDTFPWSTAAR